MEQSFEVFIEELAADEALRQSFFRNPEQTLLQADEWGVPLSTTELQEFVSSRTLVVRVGDALSARLQAAA